MSDGETAERKGTFWDGPESPPDGAWTQKRRLAAALRRAVSLALTSDAPEWTLSDAADDAERLVERLSAHPCRTFGQAIGSCVTRDDFARYADRSMLMGWSNPFAPPLVMSMEGEVAVANVTFAPVYEGIPNHVHGGMLAACFDQLFGYLQVKRNTGSLTGELIVRYRKPTPLGVPIRMEARLNEVEGRRSTVQALLMIEKTRVVCAEADAIFIAVDPTRFRSVIAGNASSNTSES